MMGIAIFILNYESSVLALEIFLWEVPKMPLRRKNPAKEN